MKTELAIFHYCLHRCDIILCGCRNIKKIDIVTLFLPMTKHP